MILFMEKILRQLIGSLSILYKVLYFPSGAGFLPLTVSLLRCASSFSFFRQLSFCQDPPGYIPNPRAKGADMSHVFGLRYAPFFCVEGVGDFCDSKKLGEIPFQS